MYKHGQYLKLIINDI